MGKKEKKGMKTWVKGVLAFSALMATLAAYFGYFFYKMIYSPNVTVPNAGETYVFIKPGVTAEDVFAILYARELVLKPEYLEWVAERKRYAERVKPGRYLLRDGMSSNELVNLLRSGNQSPVQLTFNNIRTKDDLASVIARQLSFRKSALLAVLDDKDFLAPHGFTPETALSVFLPNTYEVYWDITPQDLFLRMKKEYDAFWDERRLAQASARGLEPFEVMVLASIVQAEQSQHDSEKPTIAGLYLNRLEKGWPLESDPTLIFALGDFTIRRVLNEHKLVDSPYNTYKNAGLPPGPINLPELSSIRAVLEAEKHDYMFMCAKPDFSGLHNFARTLSQHNMNAAAYHRALDAQRQR